jgi:hypothetical protein
MSIARAAETRQPPERGELSSRPMSIYRKGGDQARPTLLLLCARCAASAQVPADRDSFVCMACAHEQPILRAEMDEESEIRSVSAVSGAYRELNDFAATIGGPEGAFAHTVAVDGLELRVGIELNSGSPCGLTMTAFSAGFPGITLKNETDEEVYAKERGITREVQVGDAKFDARVFIDSDAIDADVLAVLAPPAVRAAIVILLERFSEVRFDQGGVAAKNARDWPGICGPSELRKSIAALRVLAGAPRPIAPTTTRPSGLSNVVMGYALSGVPMGIPLLIAAGVNYAPVHPFDLVAPAAIVGVFLAALAMWPMGRVFRGRSGSHRSLATARGGALFSTPVHAIAIALFLNGLLDRSPERTDVLVVNEVSYDEEDHDSNVYARREESDLGTVHVKLDDPRKLAKVGQDLTLHTRAGALGVRWSSRPAKLDVGGGFQLTE